MSIEVSFRIESFCAMIKAELLIYLVTTKVKLKLGIVDIGLTAAKVSADEANFSIEVMKSLSI